MSFADEVPRNNERYAASFEHGHLPPQPRRQVSVVTCMDARLDVYSILGLQHGDAHVIRNAGGVVTDDVIRSLLISQRMLGTHEIILMNHTECGLLTFTDEQLKARIQAETGLRPTFALEAFSELDAELRQSAARIKTSPFLPQKDHVRGFVYDVRSGRVREVSL